LAILQTAQDPNESVRDYLSRLFDILDQVVLAVGINRLRPEIKAIVMNREPKNIEELWHSATLAEKTISSTVSSIDHKLSQILALHQHISQASRFPPHETDSYQNRPFVEEYQIYKQPQYPQFNSRKNYQAESRNTYLPPPQNIYRQNRDRTQEGTRIEPSVACFVTIKGIPEIYVQLKTKHVIIAIKIGHFSRACLNVKRPQ
jgi:hypothetical protein